MSERSRVYFASDVHLGLKTGDPKEREDRFLAFLKGIPRSETAALCLLGDIWDFWYEYRDVVPKTGMRVVAQLVDLMDAGVEVVYVPGNHDIWCYSFFEELGMRKVEQPCYLEFGGKTFCIGHGDRLGKTKTSFRLLQWVFHNKFIQALFSCLHPWFAFRLGLDWSHASRKSHSPYVWKGVEEPLYKYAAGLSASRHADYYMFGHLHVAASEQLPDGSRLVVLNDWMGGGMPYALFDGAGLAVSD